MNEYVVDTVALILRLESRQMGSQARQTFVAVEQNQARLHVPTIVFAEILYLAERKRITTTLSAVQIAATALHLKLPLLTNDPKIAASSYIKTLW